MWINGVHVKRHTSGYLGFDVDLSKPLSKPLSTADAPLLPELKYGDDGHNVIVVRADASFGSGHWWVPRLRTPNNRKLLTLTPRPHCLHALTGPTAP